MYNIAVGITVVLILITLVVLFCAILMKIHLNKQRLHVQQLYQKDIDFQKALNQTIIETQEQVMNTISQDLHDDAGQQLTFINFQLENLKLDDEKLAATLQPVSNAVKNLSATVRSISRAMNNQLLLKQDLLQAITAEVKRLQSNKTIQINLRIEKPQKKNLKPHEKIIIYRIFQEVMNNIFKHSEATVVTITIKTLPRFQMKIVDNGIGFEVEDVQNKSITLGLQNITNRAAVIEYNFDIQSKNNQGTTVILSEK
jgi:signal transduction histidine kinase